MVNVPIELTKDELNNLCKMGQGEKCCMFILVHPDYGIICAKNSPMRFSLNEKANSGQFTAIGDNCEGKAWPT